MPDANSPYLNRPTRSFKDAARAIPPFVPGDRVISRAEPWMGSWIVTGCKARPCGGFSVHLRDGTVAAIESAAFYMLAPAGWVDPPTRPTGRLILDGNSGHYPTFDEAAPDYTASLAAWHRAYADWAEQHLIPLGFTEYAARTQCFAGEQK